ncbi:hypothetical protein BDZ89DRAFT_1169160 [Hymenopellis radicata]|nr:hypothetical protein BDZ89DRAFT_1169160 [Hymenopellis radicata]
MVLRDELSVLKFFPLPITTSFPATTSDRPTTRYALTIRPTSTTPPPSPRTTTPPLDEKRARQRGCTVTPTYLPPQGFGLQHCVVAAIALTHACLKHDNEHDDHSPSHDDKHDDHRPSMATNMTTTPAQAPRRALRPALRRHDEHDDPSQAR